MQKKKNLIYLIRFSMLGNKGGGTQSLLSAALDNMVGPVGSHFTSNSYICTQKIKDANSVQSHSITIYYSRCCLKWSNLKRPFDFYIGKSTIKVIWFSYPVHMYKNI